jgi:hypothetical protein
MPGRELSTNRPGKLFKQIFPPPFFGSSFFRHWRAHPRVGGYDIQLKKRGVDKHLDCLSNYIGLVLTISRYIK